MIRATMAICLLHLGALSALADDEALESYSTDWLTPPISISGEPGNVYAIDLAIQKEAADRWAGAITLYLSKPAFNEFGDADKRRLKTRKLAVTFVEAKALPDMEQLFRQPTKRTGVLYQTAGQAALTGVKLVLDPVQPADCRLLVIGAKGRIVRMLPLQSERLRRQAELHPPASALEMELMSDFFIGYEGRMNFIKITGAGGKLSFHHDRNGMGLDRLGNLESMTMMAFPAWTCSLKKMLIPDPTGQERRVFRCELGLDQHMIRLGAKRVMTDFEEAFLVLDPREGGWHRLLLKTEGKIDRILPMHSERLHAWLLLKSQLTDETEQRVLERLSRDIPYYSDFTLEGGRVTFARIKIPAGNEAVLASLAELPHLTDLEIQGDIVDGSHLERFTRLARLRISHGSVSEDVLRRVGRLTQLKSLEFYTLRLDCRGLAHLAGLRKLTRFDYSLGDSGPFVQNYEDSCVSVFSKLPELQDLNLHALPLTPAAVAMLPTSKQLARVQFGGQIPVSALLRYSQATPSTRIDYGGLGWRLADGEVRLPHWVTNDDLGELKNIANLHTLFFERPDAVTDEGLAHLRPLRLKQLDLVQARNLTDAGIAHVSEIETLESLNLWYCEKLTNAAIADLKRLPKLKQIKLFGTKIDEQAFKSAMPNCEIVR